MNPDLIVTSGAMGVGLAELLLDTGRVPEAYKKVIAFACSFLAVLLLSPAPYDVAGAQAVVVAGIISGLSANGFYGVASSIAPAPVPKV